MDYPLAQKVHPSYTNFSLVPETITQYDIESFLLGGRKGTNVAAANSSSSRKQMGSNKKRGPSHLFPDKLHQVLSDPTLSEVIAWMPHGRSWSILNSSAFVERVSQKYFSQNKLDSFRRQVSGWGFRRKKEGADRGSYYHELFLRGIPHLAQYMETLKPQTLKSAKSTIGNVGEPDLFTISTMYPVPLEKQKATERVEMQEHDYKTQEGDAVAAVGTYAPVLSGTSPSSPVASYGAPCSTLPTIAAAIVSPIASLTQERTVHDCPSQRTQRRMHNDNNDVPAKSLAIHTITGEKRARSDDSKVMERKRQRIAAGKEEGCRGTALPAAALLPSYLGPALCGLRHNEDGYVLGGDQFDDADEDDDKGGIFDDAPEGGSSPIVMPSRATPLAAAAAAALISLSSVRSTSSLGALGRASGVPTGRGIRQPRIAIDKLGPTHVSFPSVCRRR